MTNQSLRGFDDEFTDLDHYIRVITHRIWEERRIEDIRRYYSDPCIVETPSSVSTSIDDVIIGTRATLQMFPDRRLLAEDIIWSGDAEAGFLSSHRIISPMTHRGAGIFGEPTGHKISVRTIADCVCKDNRIIHEWLVRDQAAIAVQIGLKPRELAQQWLNARGGWRKPIAGAAPAGYVSHLSANSVAQNYAAAITDFAHQRAAPQLAYDEAAQQFGPGGQIRYGRDDIAHYWQALFAALAVRTVDVEHLAFQQGGGRPDRVAIRWRALATHQGPSFYGHATGKSVEILGINHAEFVGGHVLREWVLIDDVALWMQILDPREPNDKNTQT